MSTLITPRSNLLEDTEGEEYFSSKPSYYKRGNLLPSSSFRQKYGFRRSRSSSYTSLNEESLTDIPPTVTSSPSPSPPSSTSFFSRRMKLSQRSNTAPSSSTVHTQSGDYYYYDNSNKYVEGEDDQDDSDENTFFAKQNSQYSRQNLGKPQTSWKSNMLKAVGVKNRK